MFGSRVEPSRAIELAGQKGVTPNQIALAYLLHHPFVVFPIVGTSRPEHVREALAAASVQLSHQECAFLSEHVRRVGPACEGTG